MHYTLTSYQLVYYDYESSFQLVPNYTVFHKKWNRFIFDLTLAILVDFL